MKWDESIFICNSAFAFSAYIVFGILGFLIYYFVILLVVPIRHVEWVAMNKYKSSLLTE